MRVYIAGLISKGGTLSEDQIRENLIKFAWAEDLIRMSGLDVYSPLWHSPYSKKYQPSTDLKTWEDYMRADIKELVTCDAIFPLEGWEDSPGAVLEMHIAEALHMRIMTKEDFLVPPIPSRE